MAPVEWTVLEGGPAETVLSNLLYSEQNDAVRVRPSRGDRGIDVLVPVDTSGEPFDVYQIKKFADSLGDSEKRQITDSFRRFLIGVGRQGVPAADWYLMMPMDPTVDGYLTWFHDMPDAVIEKMFGDATLALTEEEKQRIITWRQADGRGIEWKGRTYCDHLAAKYPFVVDYYLHGGQQTIRDAVKDLASLLKTDKSLPDSPPDADAVALVTPAELYGHLAKLQSVLDTDPHYRYGVSLDPTQPELVEQPNLVAATQLTQPDGQTVTFRIYQRFAESLRERPVPIKLTFATGDSTFDRQAFEMWHKYGTKLSAPAQVDADLPGGLGGAFSSGAPIQVSIGPVGQNQELRFRIRRPDGTAGAELPFSMYVSQGTAGISGNGTDHTGQLAFTVISDSETRTGTWNFTRAPTVGVEIEVALPSIEFLQDLQAPNVLQIAQKYGQFTDYAEIPAVEPLIFPEPVLDYLRALTVIQPFTATPILVPDLTKLTVRDLRTVGEAATLVGGQAVLSSWDTLTMAPDAALEEDGPESNIDFTSEYQILIVEKLIVTVGQQELTLGSVSKLALSARYGVDGNTVVARPYRNDSVQKNFSPLPDAAGPLDRRVLGRIVGPIDDTAAKTGL
jgi:hypothetical protein